MDSWQDISVPTPSVVPTPTSATPAPPAPPPAPPPATVVLPTPTQTELEEIKQRIEDLEESVRRIENVLNSKSSSYHPINIERILQTEEQSTEAHMKEIAKSVRATENYGCICVAVAFVVLSVLIHLK